MADRRRELVLEEDARWAELLALVDAAPTGVLVEPGVTAEWSARDLLAHLGCWMAEAAKVLERLRFGTYEPRELDVDAMNREFDEATRDLTLSEVRAELESARIRMLQGWDALAEVSPPAEEWFSESGPLHLEEHLPALRTFLEERGIEAGPRRPRLGVMGGTFDPIHNGHLLTAEEARWQFRLDAVVFVPTGMPWMKAERAVSPAEDRYLMAVIATSANPRFSVSRVEIEREGPTYTVDTLRAIQEEHGDVELFFITGADAMLEIFQWKDPEDALSLAHFIAATRPGYDLSSFEAGAPTEHTNVSVMPIPALAISSTDIRERVAAGRPIRYLVPDGVQTYIEKAGLYRERGSGGG